MAETDDETNAFPHLDHRGEAHMVDVGHKTETRRVAEAEAFLRLRPDTMALLQRGAVEKGDALAVARIAGIAASKKTADLVVLCHPIALSHVRVDIELDPELEGARVRTRTESSGPTGVEMEALTAAAAAALNLYDMIKKMDRGASIEHVRLVHKSGGASGDYHREE